MQPVVVGEDYRSGFERKGTPELLEEYGRKYSYETRVIPKEMNGNRKISSTFIREELNRGNMKKVSELLGRDFCGRYSRTWQRAWTQKIFSDNESDSFCSEADAAKRCLCNYFNI